MNFTSDESEQKTLDKLSKNFHVFKEGDKVVLRKYQGGMYSTDFDPEKVMQSHVKDVDVSETDVEQTLKFGVHLQTVLKSYGYSGLNDLEKGERKKVDNLAKKLEARSLKMDYKRFPISEIPSQGRYRAQFMSQMLHNAGVTDPRMLPVQQRTKIRADSEHQLKQLNDINHLKNE